MKKTRCIFETMISGPVLCYSQIDENIVRTIPMYAPEQTDMTEIMAHMSLRSSVLIAVIDH